MLAQNDPGFARQKAGEKAELLVAQFKFRSCRLDPSLGQR